MTTVLTEKGGRRISLPEGKGDKYLVRLMGWEPGADVVEGSSADYPVAAIKRDFAEAFPAGTRMRANHDGFCEAGGDIRRIMAKTVDTPWPEEDGMYAHAVFAEGDYSKFVAEFGDVIGLSISAGCTLEMEPIDTEDEDAELVPKRSERGAVIVERFLSAEESPYNSVDVVEAPGADGRIVARALEAARSIVEHTTIREAATFAKGTRKTVDQISEASPQRKHKKEHEMEPEEIAAIVEQAAEAAVTHYAESQRPAAPEQPQVGDLAEAVIAAGLSEAGRKSVYERLGRGEALEGAIAAEQAREADIQAEVDRRVEAALAERQVTERDVFEFGFTSDDKTGKPLGTEEAGVKSSEAFDEFEAAFTEGN